MFTECRILVQAYHTSDKLSQSVIGRSVVLTNGSFIAVLSLLQGMFMYWVKCHSVYICFSEVQLERYISYCTKTKYSFVHIDATGGILKPIFEQKQSLLYVLVFKDGDDPNDTIAVAHAILADHTIPSIAYFFGNFRQNVFQIKSKTVLPSFFVIDFSAAMMNAILQAFNEENVNTHLNRCWNVLYRKYTVQQLRSLSFIHLCCCHVMHAVARSFNARRIDKEIRRGVLFIFASSLCSDNMKQLYDMLGCIISIFGDPDESHAMDILERMLSSELMVDKESISMLTDTEKIMKEAEEKEEELKIVDEYFCSHLPIIHQSPFNKEAVRLYPRITRLINSKSKFENVTNPLFSTAIIRIFYHWWAYLPLWSGLMLNFQERYAHDILETSCSQYSPIRHSNALIESYFRTLKKSILNGKRNTRPGCVVMNLYEAIQVQFKAAKFGVTQKSKGRKKKKNVIVEEKWAKGKDDKDRRNVYFKIVDNFISRRSPDNKHGQNLDNLLQKMT